MFCIVANIRIGELQNSFLTKRLAIFRSCNPRQHALIDA